MYVASKEGNIGLSAKLNAEFFNLFINGYSTQEIQKQNPAFKLGLIVKARVENHWDKLKNDHIQAMMVNVAEAAQRTQLEAIRFTADAISAHHKELGSAFRKFIQTGNPADLGSYKDQLTLKNYQQYIDLFLRLSGQDQKKTVSGEITHTLRDKSASEKLIDFEGSDILKLVDKLK